ncbi:DUF1553 domain-containing protein [Bremerella cremea]|uniref:S-layer protein n=1 Tax=Blastopirellula marina TaxID=124 RepID=A0A2S8G8A2_9BACT|nr:MULTISPECIES: DUF1549 and DUF1553 domain-containing protein [Pirellulaceae]PQO40530.1 S-layer protein [Blastopirellula marina]RCS52112.1 DUF1553 domain-containing protein [Bremerella cremea]
MTTPRPFFVLALLAATYTLVSTAARGAEDAGIELLPKNVLLDSPFAEQLLIVQSTRGDELGTQVRGDLKWSSSDENVVTVEEGRLSPIADGEATVTAEWNGQKAVTSVKVKGLKEFHVRSFRNDVLPIFAKRDCNSGGCHGALAGKGGFRLSLRGYDPESDFFNIVKQDQGRRIELAAPERSLLLTKPSTAIPHKGGLKLPSDSNDFQIVADWIARGAAPPEPSDAVVDHIEVYPSASLQSVGSKQDFVVRAFYSDGSERDVTRWTKWSSTNDAVSQVSEEGQASIIGPGEGAIVAWYASKLAIARTTVPYTHEASQEEIANADQRAPRNFIDEQVDSQLKRLNLIASPNCTDAEFLRRAYLDTVGRIPTVDETRGFLADTSKDKRDKLIERLLESSEFVDYWTYKWSDVLMLNGTLLRPAPIKAYYEWIHGHVEKNTPWDVMVREIVTATGESTENGATNFFALNQTPEEMTENASQSFMGLSIGCAKCHNHPLEKWTNDQYYAMANIFSRVKAKGWGGESRNGDGARTLYVVTSGELVQPRTGKPQPPTPLDGEAIAFDNPDDRRVKFANWLTSSGNPYFAKAITNRVWANFFGVGLVEEVDDLRVSNPASNGELLEAATKHVVDNKFDLKTLMRAILQSNAYQRTSKSVAGNEAESRFYSRYYPRRLMAEVLHDAVVQVTDVPTKFDTVAFPGNDKQKTEFYPEGTKAIQLYDSAVENYFLDAFGRNPRNIVCECERSAEPTMVQVLHISNGNTINEKLESASSRVETLLQLRHNGLSDEALVDEIYLTCFSRFPTAEKREELLKFLTPVGSADERATIEDIFWGLMSTREFLFNH